MSDLVETLKKAYALIERLGDGKDDDDISPTLDLIDDEIAIASGDAIRDELDTFNASRKKD